MFIFGEDEGVDDDDRELSLDMADFLADGNIPQNIQRPALEAADAEIYAGEREDCSNCGEEAEDDNAQESTFVENISYLPEPEQSLEMKPFDNIFDNMDLSMMQKEHSFVLPRSFPKTR